MGPAQHRSKSGPLWSMAVAHLFLTSMTWNQNYNHSLWLGIVLSGLHKVIAETIYQNEERRNSICQFVVWIFKIWMIHKWYCTVSWFDFLVQHISPYVGCLNSKSKSSQLQPCVLNTKPSHYWYQFPSFQPDDSIWDCISPIPRWFGRFSLSHGTQNVIMVRLFS